MEVDLKKNYFIIFIGPSHINLLGLYPILHRYSTLMNNFNKIQYPNPFHFIESMQIYFNRFTTPISLYTNTLCKYHDSCNHPSPPRIMETRVRYC